MDSSFQNLVLHAFSDVDIYENTKQTSLCEVFPEIWFFFPFETCWKSWPSAIVEWAVYTKEKWSYFSSHLTWRGLLYIFINVQIWESMQYQILATSAHLSWNYSLLLLYNSMLETLYVTMSVGVCCLIFPIAANIYQIIYKITAIAHLNQVGEYFHSKGYFSLLFLRWGLLTD